jgi:steroid delta-isomerase-like uncharacterized protein
MDNEAGMRELYEYVNAGDVEGFADLIADDFVEHEETPGIPPTKEGVKQFFTAFIAAFPDLRMDVEDVIASGDKIVARVRVTGTHEGEFMGIPPTGKKIDIQTIDIIRVDAGGKAVEHWGVTDGLKMMQQLGVIPEGAPA